MAVSMTISEDVRQAAQAGVADVRLEGCDFVFANVPICRTATDVLNMPYEIRDFRADKD